MLLIITLLSYCDYLRTMVHTINTILKLPESPSCLLVHLGYGTRYPEVRRFNCCLRCLERLGIAMHVSVRLLVTTPGPSVLQLERSKSSNTPQVRPPIVRNIKLFQLI